MLSRRWFKSYPDKVEKKLNIEIPEVTLIDFLQKAVRINPDHPALVFENKVYTYKQIDQMSRKLASSLHDRGVTKGTRVSLMMNNCPELIISYYAVLYLGGIVVQNNPMYTNRELMYQFKDSESHLLIIENSLFSKISSIESQINNIIIARQDKHIKYDTVSHLINKGDGIIPNMKYKPKEDIAVLQYTGGTTGVSKGVMLSHYNLVANVIQTYKFLGVNARFGEEKVLNVLPLFHVYGMTVSMNYCLYLQSTLYLVERFQAEEILSIIENEKITMFPGTPTIYVSVIESGYVSQYDLSSIHTCISGSSPLSIDTKQSFEKLTGAKLVDAYGLSEASPVTHSNPVNGIQKPGSMGLPIIGTDCKIVDLENGFTELKVNEPGELIIKGPQVMLGYWKKDEETKQTLRDNWLYTGDIAYMDDDGYCFIVSRKKDVIIASGYNIYPREIEEILFEHPAIAEAVVYGIRDAYRGETTKAAIVLRKDFKNKISKKEIIEYCKSNMANYKVPTSIEFRDDLPKSTVGKVLRRKLIDEELNA